MKATSLKPERHRKQVSSSSLGKVLYPVLPLVVAATSAVLLAGCDAFLERAPSDEIGATEFFQNEGQVDQAVIGIYSELRAVYDDKWRFTEVRSDNTLTMWNPSDRGDHPTWIIEEWTMTPSNLALEPYWENIYQGIQRANAVLNNAENAQFSSEATRDQLIGEAQFIRAFLYFDLVRLWGGAPLVLEQVQSPDAAFSTLEERASSEALYEQVISDATAAVDLLPAENPGRATEGAARTLLAKVHMTQGNYADAVSQMEAVVGIGYTLLPDYADLFDTGNEGNREEIFSVQYAELQSDIDLGGQFLYLFAPLGSGTEITGDNEIAPSGLNIPSRSMLDAYEEGDERMEASVGFYVDPENSQYGIALGDTIPYVAKYASPHSVRGVTSDNWPVYRYAEVLLLMAEALNEMGQTGRAYEYVNSVRQRAGLNDLEAGLPQAQFREAVYREQRVELAFENDRWFDLLRTGRALQEMRAYAEVYRGLQPHWQEPAYDIQEYKLQYPIPQRERSLNPGLEQTPGW